MSATSATPKSSVVLQLPTKGATEGQREPVAHREPVRENGATAPPAQAIDKDHATAPHGSAPPAPSSSPRRAHPRNNEPNYRPRQLLPNDGRVTGVVPTKLQAQATGANGNFAVIHIDIRDSNRTDRDTAAQRTSERTAAAASAYHASHKEYRAIRPLAKAHRPLQPISAQSMPAPYSHLHQHNHPAPHQPYQSSRAEASDPTLPSPELVKKEQARLLALLKSIEPSSIVDQLCKGVTFFGGGDPAQAGSMHNPFPNSQFCNGSGAFFITWLSEIFPPVYPAPGHAPDQCLPSMPRALPHLSLPSAPLPPAALWPPPRSGLQPGYSSRPSPGIPPEQLTDQPHGSQAPTGTPSQQSQPEVSAASGAQAAEKQRKKRGRPIGSKSKGPRKDKGIRKGPVDPNQELLPGRAQPEDAYGCKVGEPIKAWNTQRTPEGVLYLSKDKVRRPYFYPSGKRRGRPPGAKNRPKASAEVVAQQSPPSSPTHRVLEVDMEVAMRGEYTSLVSQGRKPRSMREHMRQHPPRPDTLEDVDPASPSVGRKRTAGDPAPQELQTSEDLQQSKRQRTSQVPSRTGGAQPDQPGSLSSATSATASPLFDPRNTSAAGLVS